MENERNIAGLISEKEKSLALFCMEAALRHGAAQVRVSLSKSVLDTCGMLNGELDKVTHSADRSVFLNVFADDRYGTFSTNMLDEKELESFAAQAVESVRTLARDSCRRLPDPERTAKIRKKSDCANFFCCCSTVATMAEPCCSQDNAQISFSEMLSDCLADFFPERQT